MKKIALRKNGKIVRIINLFPDNIIVSGDVQSVNSQNLETEIYSGTNEYTPEGHRIFEYKKKEVKK